MVQAIESKKKVGIGDNFSQMITNFNIEDSSYKNLFNES